MAKKYNVELEVLSSMVKAPGTIVKEDSLVERTMISGVAADKNTARVSIVGLKDVPGIAFKVFNCMAKKNINVDMILQSIGRDNTKDITFTVSEEVLVELGKIIKQYTGTHMDKTFKSLEILEMCLK